ncbi:MAG: hypothetical protein K9K65_08975 [Desulfarculaceae bacterium]|nr:hypothetical protein [Desulfarculaceae bacterium]MCF8046158.1 hypothetical protein [Desulfarculaceae bacterium]MCF8097960.1 hypothetical protein [Desulfarculaceae bacterium]MCF8123993.1 hypothetical protein [Desulfarculaceae bacterium]
MAATATLALILSYACGGPPSAPPAASTDLGAPHGVSRPAGPGWQGDMVFAGYKVHGIQAEKPVQKDWAFVGMRGLVMRQAASYVVSGKQGDWYCRCALGGDYGGMALNIGTMWGHGFTLDPSHSTVLACIMTPAQGGKTWRMSLYSLPAKWRDAGKDPNASGALSDAADVTIRIQGKGVMSVEGVGGGRPPEYRFLGENGEMAQVRVQAPQEVRLPQGGLRGPLAAAAAGILVGHGDAGKK